VTELRPSADTVTTGYAEIAGGVWLGGDRWAVVAPLDVTVGLVEPRSRRVAPLGGEGSRELRNPAHVFLAGDTLHVSDWGLRRTSLWTLDGKLLRSIPTTDGVRGALPLFRDTTGRFFLELKPRPRADGSGNRDSAAVVRASPDLARFDTVAHLAPLDMAEVTGDAGRRFERRALSGEDRWGAAPDGSVWVARVYENRVDWRSPDGEWERGQPLPDRVLEVTRYDREVFYRKFPPELRSTAEQLPFAAVKPPFEAGLIAPSGEVWLEKSRAPVDSSRRYHVVDRQGACIIGATRLVAERLRGAPVSCFPPAATPAESLKELIDEAGTVTARWRWPACSAARRPSQALTPEPSCLSRSPSSATWWS
jgi:hypothetical protein